MSNKVTAICRLVRLPSTHKCVLMSLADLADDSGVTDAPIASICDWTCYGRTAVIDALKGLQEAQLLALGRDQGRASRYEIRLEKVPALVANQSASRTGTCPPDGWVGPDPSARRTGVVRQPDGLPPNPSASRTGSSQLRTVCIKDTPSEEILEREKKTPFCAELDLQPSKSDPIAIVLIPLVDGTQFPVTQAHVDEWAAAFPAIDVVGALRRARVWCNDNPKKRKTKAGVRKFLSGWMGREQDRGGTFPSNNAGHGSASNSRHSGLYEINHTEGVPEDGSLA